MFDPTVLGAIALVIGIALYLRPDSDDDDSGGGILQPIPIRVQRRY
ncbi:hypothetical protein [Synechococcus sp. UW140]|jgi:hypothetical protein|nr:hypothetical protein [Synechococcus sp. UW140]MCX5928810.1 hypothetical protein [Synechococcus sp. LacPavin_0920_WC12_MAG_50_7]MDA0291570.1 hypothetical protein [Cyanobacteriota bacterium]MDA1169741.1 hypothetical protein [Cyanobacteriota bacterium]